MTNEAQAMRWYKRLTVYHYLIAVLIFLGIFYIIHSTRFDLAYQLILAPTVAVLLEAAISKLKGKPARLESALICGLLVSLIMPSIYFALATTAVAILIKHILRINGNQIFNPAAAGIVTVSIIAGLLGFVNSSPAEWWGATSFLIIPFGLFIAWKIRRLELSLTLLVVYFALLILSGFTNGSFNLNSLYDIGVFFFAFFMVTEPKTSLASRNGKIISGAILASLMFAGNYLPLRYLTADWFLVSLMIANIFNAANSTASTIYRLIEQIFIKYD